MKKVLIIFILLFSTKIALAQEKYSLTIKLEKTDSSEGKIYVGLYNSKADFLKTEYMSKIVSIKNGEATVMFEDLNGVYAVSAFYDANNNGKLDANFLGIPKEPTKMSNNAKGSLGPPKFEDAKFTINKDTIIQLTFNN